MFAEEREKGCGEQRHKSRAGRGGGKRREEGGNEWGDACFPSRGREVGKILTAINSGEEKQQEEEELGREIPKFRTEYE